MLLYRNHSAELNCENDGVSKCHQLWWTSWKTFFLAVYGISYQYWEPLLDWVNGIFETYLLHESFNTEYFCFQIQFVITFTHSLQTYVSGCDFPLWGQYLLMGYMIIMVILFGNFYVQSYIKRKNDQVRAKKTDAVNGSSNSYIKNGNHNKLYQKQDNASVTNGSYVVNGNSYGAVKQR